MPKVPHSFTRVPHATYDPPAPLFLRRWLPPQGIALIERKGGGDDKTATVSYVPASGLPFAPAERLAELFRMKPKWPMGELEPYIS